MSLWEFLLLLATRIPSPLGEPSTTVAERDAGCHKASHAPGVSDSFVNPAALQLMARAPCQRGAGLRIGVPSA